MDDNTVVEVIDDNKIECSRCHRRMLRKEFYVDKNGNPMARCKKCMTSMIDINSPSTFRSVLEEIDIPYAPLEWEKLKDRYEYVNQANGTKRRNPNANQSILGRYIGKMKLAQYKDLIYADTERFIQEESETRENNNVKLLDKFKSFLETGLNEEEALAAMGMPVNTLDETLSEGPKSFYKKEEFTELQIKWGFSYLEKEIVQLENFYNDMKSSYDITTASHEDYLRQICKASYRMHQAIDTGDTDTFTKLSAVYDKMMKSAKFTASQEKEEERFIDSISEMVKLCEEQGFIPLYHTFEEDDIVDVTEKDLKKYTSNLIRGELGLGDLIEQAVESIKLEEAKDNIDENGEVDLFEVEVTGPTEEDYLEDLAKEIEDLGPIKEFEKVEISIDLEGDSNE